MEHDVNWTPPTSEEQKNFLVTNFAGSCCFGFLPRENLIGEFVDYKFPTLVPGESLYYSQEVVDRVGFSKLEEMNNGS